MKLSDPTAERDALILLVSATFIGCQPVIQQLPEGNRSILAAALRQAFETLGLDVHNEAKARQQLVPLLREVESRRRPGLMGKGKSLLETARV